MKPVIASCSIIFLSLQDQSQAVTGPCVSFRTRVKSQAQKASRRSYFCRCISLSLLSSHVGSTTRLTRVSKYPCFDIRCHQRPWVRDVISLFRQFSEALRVVWADGRFSVINPNYTSSISYL
ncbi:hypothetical protein BDP27DRAFT_380120 [Rhodocollybia butyracea]|uniref:Secreted protein n=1 Tax=Rhodocollybia butyracea TaxID=206335 RepID=A0A9P5PD73_9AGAR|nr:hypothetical protein BDP27DRAFT_380120 [Rhodocollybia butyracea]